MRVTTAAALCGLLALTIHSVSAQSSPALTRTDYPSHSGARAMAVADFNNDGWVDIAHANTGRDSLTVLLNRRGARDGFARQAEAPVGHGPFAMATADFNLDGSADLAVANADDDTISILVGRGDGTFSHTRRAAPGNPRGIATADINRDGRPDLVYTGFANNRVQVLLGNGAGGFTTGAAFVGHASRPQGVAAADFNRDGVVDLAVTYASTGGGLAVLTMAPGGTPSAVGVAGPDDLNVLTTGDFNQDGWQDVAAASTGHSRMAMYIGGPGGLRHVATQPTGVSPRGIVSVDLDHDGLLDVVTSNHGADTVSVFTQQAGGAWTAAHFPSGRGSRAVAVADFDHDGRSDLATANQAEPTATVHWNDTPLVAAAFAFERGDLASPGTFDEPVGAFDLNHNGRPDLLMRTYVSLDATTVRALPPLFHAYGAADFNGDGHLDLAGKAHDSNPFPVARILAGDGLGGFAHWQDLPTPPGLQHVAVADMNRDGLTDVVMTTYTTGAIPAFHLYLRRADGGWASPRRTDLPSWAIALLIADLNRDGVGDLIITHYQPATLSVFLGNSSADGGFAPSRTYGLTSYAADVAAGDVNHDGATDLVAASGTRVVLLLGSPTGELAPREIDSSAANVALADMNLDGHLDIITGHSTISYGAGQASRILPGRGDGTFAPPDDFLFEAGYYLLIADVNVDGLPDVVTAWSVQYNLRTTENRNPVIMQLRGAEIEYAWQFEDEPFELWAQVGDPDQHAVHYEWRDQSGTLLSRWPYFATRFLPGTHDVTLTVTDGRGGAASQTVQVVVRPTKEAVMAESLWYRSWFWPRGTWRRVEDESAAGEIRFQDPNANAPRASAPLAEPVNSLEVSFIADPTQTYKFWIRGKAENNHWANDSVFLQFSGAVDVNGTPVYRVGTTSSLAINLEECSGCGLSGWGWRDERWGANLNASPVLLRFPQGGWQRLTLQSREDGLSIDQIVLSAERYLTARPGAAKNDRTILRPPWEQ